MTLNIQVATNPPALITTKMLLCECLKKNGFVLSNISVCQFRKISSEVDLIFHHSAWVQSPYPSPRLKVKRVTLLVGLHLVRGEWYTALAYLYVGCSRIIQMWFKRSDQDKTDDNRTPQLPF